MDVNQVRFGNYTIGSSQAHLGKKEEAQKESVQQQEVKSSSDTQKMSADDFFNAMNISGLQNRAQISSIAKKEVNPSDYLSEDRIRDIQAMMGKFDSGVNQVANTIEQEFPGLFKPESKMALAAQIFSAQE